MRYAREGDYRVALVLAAISLETALVRLLRRRLVQRRVATASQIDKFLEEMSNRLLSSVVLGLLRIGDTSLRERCRRVFDLRNQVVHGKRGAVRREEAGEAIATAGAIVELALESA
jgi:hypothetical protein